MERKFNSEAGFRLIAVYLLLSAIMALGCKEDNLSPQVSRPDAPKTATVWMINGAFSPSTITILPNTNVQWTNQDYGKHTVLSSKQIFASGYITKGGTFNYLFSAPGTYVYYSVVDSSMIGTIVVSDGVSGNTGGTVITASLRQ